MNCFSKNEAITAARGYTPKQQPNYFNFSSRHARWFYIVTSPDAEGRIYRPYRAGKNVERREKYRLKKLRKAELRAKRGTEL